MLKSFIMMGKYGEMYSDKKKDLPPNKGIKLSINFRIVLIPLLNSGLYYVLSSIIISLSAFILWFIVANKITTVLYGQIRTIISIVSTIAIVFQFGLPTYNQIFFSRSEQNSNEYGSIIALKIILMAIFFVFSITYFLLVSPNYDFIIFILIIFVVLNDEFVKYLFGIYYGKNEFRDILNSTILSRGILIVSLLILYFETNNILYFLAVLLIIYFVQIFYLLRGSSKNLIRIKKVDFNMKEQWKLILILSPLAMNSICNLLYDKIDVPIISYYLGYEKAAQYSIAYSIYSLSSLGTGILFIPMLNYFSREDILYSEERRILHLFLIIVFLVAFFVSMFFLLFGKSVVLFLFSSKYTVAGEILPYFSLAIILWGLNGLTGIYLNAKKKFKYTMIATFAGLLTNIIIDIISLPEIGIRGGIIATTTTAFIVLIIECYFIRKIGNDENHISGKLQRI